MSTDAMSYVVNDAMVDTDIQGYMLNQSEWNSEIANVIAKSEGLELADEHWDVLYFLRDHYRNYNHSANARLLIKMLTKAWGPEKGGKKRLYELFPKGPARQGCKIAGLPAPIDCTDWHL